MRKMMLGLLLLPLPALLLPLVVQAQSNYAPVIIAPPQSATISQGQTIELDVTADEGGLAAFYQWYFDGAPVAGQNGTNLLLAGATVFATGAYHVAVTNTFGSVTSSPAFLAVEGPPAILAQPTNKAVYAGGSTLFNVAAGGVGPLHYQWRLNGTNLSGVMNIITTVAGNGNAGASGDGGVSTNATLSGPVNVAVDGSGNLFVADRVNNRIRKVEAYGKYGDFGRITTVAGNGTAAYAGDGGAATNASLNTPTSVTVDLLGNLFITDQGNQRIRKVDTNGIITTVAGSGNRVFAGDGGAATNANLNDPTDVKVDALGNLFIVDQSNNRIRKVGINGIITTVAGGAGGFYGGYSGDGGAATNAQLKSPNGVVIDAYGSLFIADLGNGVVRKVNTNGIITTVAGNGRFGPPCNGCAATDSNFYYPTAVAVDAGGNLFIADQGNHLVIKVAVNGILTTAAGQYSGFGNYYGDGGVATNAALNKSCGVTVDGAGNLFIADQGNNRIRRVVASAGYPTQTLANVTPNDAGNYQVIITNSFGSVTSSIATLTVLPPSISITPNPDGSRTLNLQTAPSISSRVWVTTNLALPIIWQTLNSKVAGTDGTSQFLDSNAKSNRFRFYRCSTP